MKVSNYLNFMKHAEVISSSTDNTVSNSNESSYVSLGAPSSYAAGSVIATPRLPDVTPKINLKPSIGYSYTTTQVPPQVGNQALIDTLVTNGSNSWLSSRLTPTLSEQMCSIDDGALITRAYDDGSLFLV